MDSAGQFDLTCNELVQNHIHLIELSRKLDACYQYDEKDEEILSSLCLDKVEAEFFFISFI